MGKGIPMYYKIIVSKKKMEGGIVGWAHAWKIFISPDYVDDQSVVEHEKVHVRQWWRTLGLHTHLMNLSEKYRLRIEIEAYKVTLKYTPRDINYICRELRDGYGFEGLTRRQIKRMLLS